MFLSNEAQPTLKYFNCLLMHFRAVKTKQYNHTYLLVRTAASLNNGLMDGSTSILQNEKYYSDKKRDIALPSGYI